MELKGHALERRFLRISQRIIGTLLKLRAVRREHPALLEWGIHALAALPAILLFLRFESVWMGLGRTFVRLHLEILTGPVAYEIAHYGCTTTAFMVINTSIKVAAPLLFYAPHALAMRAMGLERACIGDLDFRRCLQELLRTLGPDDKVRVICISGRHLFREPHDDNTPAPLFDLAKAGRLEVIMPDSTPSNVTIQARYSGYEPNFKASVYPTIDDLIHEINEGKKFLARIHPRNELTEHSILCMWRVILLPKYCIVQNYFPNKQGRRSDLAPVLVFEKDTECEYSYYETFDKMFNLIKRPAQELAAAGGSKPI